MPENLFLDIDFMDITEILRQVNKHATPQFISIVSHEAISHPPP